MGGFCCLGGDLINRHLFVRIDFLGVYVLTLFALHVLYVEIHINTQAGIMEQFDNNGRHE